MSLSGKVAMVTGTSANIGGGIAEELAAAGSALVCVDSREENAADCARYIKSTGGRATAMTCDVTDERQVLASVAAAREAFGGIDILVNSAAIFNKKGVIDMPLDEWQRQIEIILTGAFLFTKHVAKSMMELVAHVIRVNSLTPTATDPAESLERAARWGRNVPNAERMQQAFEPFRTRVPMQNLPSPR